MRIEAIPFADTMRNAGRKPISDRAQADQAANMVEHDRPVE